MPRFALWWPVLATTARLPTVVDLAFVPEGCTLVVGLARFDQILFLRKGFVVRPDDRAAQGSDGQIG